MPLFRMLAFMSEVAEMTESAAERVRALLAGLEDWEPVASRAPEAYLAHVLDRLSAARDDLSSVVRALVVEGVLTHGLSANAAAKSARVTHRTAGKWADEARG